MKGQKKVNKSVILSNFYPLLYLGDENKGQLLNLGALDYLLKLITHEDKIVKRNAVMAVGSMSTDGKMFFS